MIGAGYDAGQLLSLAEPEAGTLSVCVGGGGVMCVGRGNFWISMTYGGARVLLC